ncbi:MAG: hypothetical protein GC159_06990 [Phycisphaera sp.]|nr:hypothetical protein [Phycisphaera sp.]
MYLTSSAVSSLSRNTQPVSIFPSIHRLTCSSRRAAKSGVAADTPRGKVAQRPRPHADLTARHGELVVSVATCRVEWRGRQCALGPSLLFRLFHRISQHPGRYYSFDLLMNEVWQRRCSDDAVRASVKRLRRTLLDADMPDLASAIQARGRCCGLFIDNGTS